MSKRRGHGEGTIYQRSDGRWEGMLRADGKRHSVYGATRQEVQKKLAEVRRSIEERCLLSASARR